MRKNRGNVYEASDLKTGESRKFAATRARNEWIKESPEHRTVWPVNHAVRQSAKQSARRDVERHAR